MNADKARGLLNVLCFAVLLCAVLIQDNVLSTALILFCLILAIVILYRNLETLSGLSPGNPKGKTLCAVTLFTGLYLAVVIAFSLLIEHEYLHLTEGQFRYSMAAILAVPMVIFGNVAPKLPFNRYTGLRLPWTVRDEQTWILAHRVLGYISVPLALLCFAGASIRVPLDDWVKIWFLGPLLLWIGIPGVLSGWFFYRKFRRPS